MEEKTRQVAVIFEVTPVKEKMEEYLDIAAQLKSELTKVEGFISIERFQSLTNPGKILSLSIWESEAAIREWRNLEVHRTAQSRGRANIFNDYHLRVAHVVRDYGMHERQDVPEDSKSMHDGAV